MSDASSVVTFAQLEAMYREEPEMRYYDKYVARVTRAAREGDREREKDIDSVYMCRVAHAMANAAHCIQYEGKVSGNGHFIIPLEPC